MVAGGIALTNWGTFGATLMMEKIGSGGGMDHGLVIEFRKEIMAQACCVYIDNRWSYGKCRDGD
jgi:hypothetical protein